VYGASKLAGEQALQASGCHCAVVRVQWTYGAAGASFVSRFLERARAAEGPLRMVADQVGSPTWTRDVAGALTALLALRPTGLFHYAAEGAASRLEVAAFIARECGLARALEPCRTADFPAPARRPLNSRFDCRRFDALLPGRRRPWGTALLEFLRSLP
jgi:dTDP-4-dehydrorhamnose reductase